MTTERTTRTFTRPGWASITIRGTQLNVSNFHQSRRDIRWTTGIYGDRFRKTNGDRTWWFEIFILGFGIGISR